MRIKQSNHIGSNSYSLQVGRDINYGLSYEDIKKIFYDLFELNFPKLIGKAKDEIDIRINLLWQQLLNDLRNNQNEIELNHFSSPNIQYELSQITLDSARFGNIDNYSVISKLLISQLKKDSKSIDEQIISECLNIIPKLSKTQLYILIIHKIYNYFINDSDNIYNIDEKLSKYNEYFSYLLNIQDNYDLASNLYYLKLLNCLDDSSPIPDTMYNTIKVKLRLMSLNKDTSLATILESKKLYNVLKLLELTKKYTILSHKLTRIGETLVTYTIS